MFSNDHIAQIFPDGIITIDAEGRLVRANAAAESMLGWSESEMAGALIEMVIPGDRADNPGLVQNFGLQRGRIAPMAGWRQIEMQRRDGSHFPVQVWLAAETHGKDRNTTIFLRDMSELACKQTEIVAARGQLEAERAHNELLALIAEHASDVFIITDAQGVTVWVNKFTERMTGYLAHELIGRTPGAVLQGPGTDPQTVAELSRAIQAGKPIRCEILNYTKAGEPYWIDMSIAPLYGVNGELEKFIAVERDISAAKNRALELEDAKAAAETAEHRLSAAVAAMADGFSIYDASDRLLMANAAFHNFRADDAELVSPGISFEEMARHGLRLGYFDTEGLSDDEWVALQMASRQRPSAETIIKFADGRWMLRRDRRTPQGELISIRTDVTAMKRHEQQLSEARERAEAADRAKSDFVAMISHEIRTPISGILGFTEIMLADELSKVQRERAVIVKEASEHLLQLANNILDLSKIVSDTRELQSEAFVLDDLVSRTVSSVSTLADEKGLALSILSKVTPGCRVTGDPGAVKQILLNLIGNAIKFTAQGTITLSLSERDGGILFEIADTGGGIAEDKLAMIFQRFTQLGGNADRAQGAGLGLSITQHLVRLMKGRIDVTSQLGRGSVFSAWLPLPREAGADELWRRKKDRADREAEAEKTAQMFDILVAEDHVVNQRLICEILGSIGCRVSVAGNGQEALDQLDAADFDLIIMDNQMPVMTGMEAIGIIRARGDWKMRTPIIALTANAMRGAEKAYMALGVDAFITKPLNVQQVLDAVRRLAETGRKLRQEARPGAV